MESWVIVLLLLIIAIAVGGLHRTFKLSPKEKGDEGENELAYDLKKLSRKIKDGIILRNVYVPTKNGNTVEIDLLFITSRGIFVIESKNYTGYIFGDERDRNWTKTLYKGKDVFGFKQVEKIHFYNPIRQNHAHLRALRSYLGKYYRFISLIVFSGECELKKIIVESADTEVCSRSEFTDNILKYWNQLEESIPEEEIDYLYMRLLPLTKMEKESNGNKEESTAEPVTTDAKTEIAEPAAKAVLKCPYCGGELVIRTAKHGPTAGEQFYGCENFPKCRYTESIR